MLITSACTSMNQTECEATDWYDRGINDGIDGKPSGRYRDYLEDCGEFGVAVDEHAYLSGWEIGITRYCTADNGYKTGLAGERYANSCPAETADTFFSAYQLGYDIQEQQARVNSLRYQLEQVNDGLARSNISEERRRLLRRDRRHLRGDLQRAEWALRSAGARARDHGFPAPY